MDELPRQLNFAQPVLDDDTIASVVAVLKSNWITTGPKVLEFEAALSKTFNGRPTRVVTSATAAFEIALDVCNIGPEDEVILSAQSFFSTSNMVVKNGAKPVFVDCELESRAIDLKQVKAAITSRTKAIIVTHFPGALVDMDALLTLARNHGLRVIEDAALTQGSYWRDQPIGGFGDIATFSFHPNKNMTTIEGGAIVVNTEAEAKQVEVLRFHGITRLPDGTRDVIVPGGKFNLSDVSAVIGLHQLARLPAFLETRRSLAQRYFERFPQIPGIVLPPQGAAGQSWNMFCVLFPFDSLGLSRKDFRDGMHARGINTGVSYEALHLSTVGRRFGYHEGQFPNAERISRETVTLPLHAAMEIQDVDRVCETVSAVLFDPRS
jgi:dTDP-4-amino-4,6-dideoxygalactose transaminase